MRHSHTHRKGCGRTQAKFKKTTLFCLFYRDCLSLFLALNTTTFSLTCINLKMNLYYSYRICDGVKRKDGRYSYWEFIVISFPSADVLTVTVDKYKDVFHKASQEVRLFARVVCNKKLFVNFKSAITGVVNAIDFVFRGICKSIYVCVVVCFVTGSQIGRSSVKLFWSSSAVHTARFTNE